mgnify:FL=1
MPKSRNRPRPTARHRKLLAQKLEQQYRRRRRGSRSIAFFLNDLAKQTRQARRETPF